MGSREKQCGYALPRHLEILPVTLSPCASLRVNSAKGLARWMQRSFAALRMTTRTPLKSAHGRSYLQMSTLPGGPLAFTTSTRHKSHTSPRKNRTRDTYEWISDLPLLTN